MGNGFSVWGCLWGWDVWGRDVYTDMLHTHASPRATPPHSLLLPTPQLQVVTTRGARPNVCIINVLSLGVVYSVPMTVTALAVDPHHAAFAVAAETTTHPTTATAPTTTASPSSFVYVFNAGAPEITHAWKVAGPPPSSIHFLPTDTPLGAAAAPRCPGGCSPLLLVTPDRRYGLAMDAGAVAGKSSSASWEGPALQGASATDAVMTRLSTAVRGLDGNTVVWVACIHQA